MVLSFASQRKGDFLSSLLTSKSMYSRWGGMSEKSTNFVGYARGLMKFKRVYDEDGASPDAIASTNEELKMWVRQQCTRCSRVEVRDLQTLRRELLFDVIIDERVYYYRTSYQPYSRHDLTIMLYYIYCHFKTRRFRLHELNEYFYRAYGGYLYEFVEREKSTLDIYRTLLQGTSEKRYFSFAN